MAFAMVLAGACQAAIKNRYSFNCGTARDSVGGAAADPARCRCRAIRTPQSAIRTRAEQARRLTRRASHLSPLTCPRAYARGSAARRPSVRSQYLAP